MPSFASASAKTSATASPSATPKDSSDQQQQRVVIPALRSRGGDTAHPSPHSGTLGGTTASCSGPSALGGSATLRSTSALSNDALLATVSTVTNADGIGSADGGSSPSHSAMNTTRGGNSSNGVHVGNNGASAAGGHEGFTPQGSLPFAPEEAAHSHSHQQQQHQQAGFNNNNHSNNAAYESSPTPPPQQRRLSLSEGRPPTSPSTRGLQLQRERERGESASPSPARGSGGGSGSGCDNQHSAFDLEGPAGAASSSVGGGGSALSASPAPAIPPPPPITAGLPPAELAALVAAHAAFLAQREHENRWLYSMMADEEMATILHRFEARVRQIIEGIEQRGKYTDSKEYQKFKEHGAAKRRELEERRRLAEEAEAREAERLGRPMILVSAAAAAASRSLSVGSTSAIHNNHHNSSSVTHASGTTIVAASHAPSCGDAPLGANPSRRDPNNLTDDLYRWSEERRHKIERRVARQEQKQLEEMRSAPSISSISGQLIDARRREDPTSYPSVRTAAGVDQRVAEHRKRIEELRRRHEPSFAPTVTPHESHARRAEQQQAVAANLSAARAGSEADGGGGAGGAGGSDNGAAMLVVSPERRLYELHKEKLERQAAREMAAAAAATAAAASTAAPRRTNEEIAEHISALYARAESGERRTKAAAMRLEQRDMLIENNGFKPRLNPKTDAYVAEYKQKAPQRAAEREEAQKQREAALAAEAARPAVVKTAPTRSEAFVYHTERTLLKKAEGLEKLRREREEKFAETYTFAPAISNTSRRMAEQQQLAAGPMAEPSYYEATEAHLWRQQAVEDSLEAQSLRRERSEMLQAGGGGASVCAVSGAPARFLVQSVTSASALALAADQQQTPIFDRRKAYEYAKTIPAPTPAAASSSAAGPQQSAASPSAAAKSGSATSPFSINPASAKRRQQQFSASLASPPPHGVQLASSPSPAAAKKGASSGRIGGATEINQSLLNSSRPCADASFTTIGANSGRSGAGAHQHNGPSSSPSAAPSAGPSSARAVAMVSLLNQTTTNGGPSSSTGTDSNCDPQQQRRLFTPLALAGADGGDVRPSAKGNGRGGGLHRDVGEEPVSDDEVGTPRDPRRRGGAFPTPPPTATATVAAVPSSSAPSASSTLTNTAKAAEDLLSRWRSMEADAARRAGN